MKLPTTKPNYRDLDWYKAECLSLIYTIDSLNKKIDKLERENAALRADIHAHEQINKQLVEDKKRLDWLAVSDVWFDEPATESYTPETFRAEIDRKRKDHP